MGVLWGPTPTPLIHSYLPAPLWNIPRLSPKPSELRCLPNESSLKPKVKTLVKSIGWDQFQELLC